VQTIDHALHVQHAVRHMPVVGEHGLFVQKVVRSAQLESAVRNAVLDAHQSSTPGYETLLDPFGLGSPRPVAEASQTARSEQDEEAKQARCQAVRSGAGGRDGFGTGPVEISVQIESADVILQRSRFSRCWHRDSGHSCSAWPPTEVWQPVP
jgi:hypothetical protein